MLRSALEALFALGARQAAAGEFTKRAFLNGRMDLTQAEAVVDIIDAETPLAARNAASQLGGAISRRTEEIYQNLTHICSHYHAVLDYPDEDIPPFTLAEYAAVLDASIRSLEALLASFSRGQFLEKGVRTARDIEEKDGRQRSPGAKSAAAPRGSRPADFEGLDSLLDKI